MSDLIRTPRHGCFHLHSNVWGSYLHPIDDPTANATLEDGALQGFELHEGISPIPSDLWARWVKLCFHFVGKVRTTTEVSCRLLRHEDDKSQWRLLVPVQAVDTASVRIDSFDSAIDIVTGEEVAEYPPQGWVPCGSSHSHNTMTLDRFSSTDDAYELGDPGLHIVISHINLTNRTYKPTASITANRRRFYLPEAQAVIDLTPRSDIDFHPNVLNAVKLDEPRVWRSSPATVMPPDGSEVQLLFLNPNAGNGYQRRDRQRPSVFDTDAPWRFSWADDLEDDGDDAILDDEAPVDLVLYDIQQLTQDSVFDCLQRNDEAGLKQLMQGLLRLASDVEAFTFDPTFFDTDSHEQSDPGFSTPGADRALAQGVRTGDW